ncbi:hypothetical protein B7494_g3930 [Chlorociboria aeruginascens]|nr:hypothetical protein B7494_g3930 [Chlorociboria aeruginascens]
MVELKKAMRRDGEESPCISGLRSIFLLFENTEINLWPQLLANSRSAYSSLRDHFMRFVEHPEELGSASDPLDDDLHSPWNNLRQDEQIRIEILQDVERIMPEKPYFRNSETQRIMLDILFIFCKINQDVGYRQGMHEILAPIMWVIEQDAIDSLKEDRDSTSVPEADSDVLLKQILDARYIEHDTFTLFSLIMRSAKSFYELGEPDHRSLDPSGGPGILQNAASPIVERSKRIHEIYLTRLDPELGKHLTDIEVLPQIFLIRWIRLLFGREFPFDDLLTLWDIIFAEDPALDLVDMICVAMLLRIRWQLIEVDYSLALMLLLKYPSPSPHGLQTFVDDAVYLRDNFQAAGGAKIISKYSGKSPSVYPSASRPSTPYSASFSPKQLLSRTRSPLPSPARFLQQQGGVEAMFQGAAKGVLDRGERLGINQAVRDAVGEMKRNMQGLQTPKFSSGIREVSKWSLDEECSVGPPVPALPAMNKRNQQLARMLDKAMTELRTSSAESDGDKDKYAEAIDLAIAKVNFVKVYLEDATIPLPPDSDRVAASPMIQREAIISPSPMLDPTTMLADQPTVSIQDASQENITTESKPSPPDQAASPIAAKQMTVPCGKKLSSPISPNIVSSVAESSKLTFRPAAPVPTRSSIAQSSFSWMLEPDRPINTAGKSSPPRPSSTFLKTGKRSNSATSREKAAFLFGEDPESDILNSRLGPLPDVDEGFNLGTIKASAGLTCADIPSCNYLRKYYLIMSAAQDNRDNVPHPDDVVDNLSNLNVGDEGRLGPDGEPLPKTDEEYAESQLTLRAIVSSKEAGVIIGKGGKNVADLRDDTGVKAGVSKVVQGVHDRVLTIAGGCEAISKAYAIVAKALLEGAPQMGMGGVVANNGTHPIKLLISHNQMGTIIGRQGLKIKHIQDVSGVRMVAQKEMLPQSTERIVEVQGSPEGIQKAIWEICKCLVDDWQRGTGTVLYNPVVRTQSGGPGGIGQGGPGNGRDYNSPRVMRTGNGADFSEGAPRYNNRRSDSDAAQRGPPTHDENGDELQTQNISIPSDMVGCIIGRAGSKISEIRKTSGARISIAKAPHDDTGERMFTIMGSVKANETALFLLYENLEAEKMRRSQGAAQD